MPRPGDLPDLGRRKYPARVVERAAMLDLLSRGRLDLGAGRGGTEQETSLCGVER
ncbi:LLM class flavin-dependent oxidoreductase [Streptomyces huasconensis]|uniref:LLM class flavin-dependent oxidoreductase n=1 Tax=Streptomyces huasconensis TaxID=1854574 RepID=A0ABV3M493_9ACTN